MHLQVYSSATYKGIFSRWSRQGQKKKHYKRFSLGRLSSYMNFVYLCTNIQGNLWFFLQYIKHWRRQGLLMLSHPCCMQKTHNGSWIIPDRKGAFVLLVLVKYYACALNRQISNALAGIIQSNLVLVNFKLLECKKSSLTPGFDLY